MVDTKEGTAKKLEKTVLIKMKKRLYREAFDKFRNQVKTDTQQEKNVDRADNLTYKFNLNQLRRIFNGWTALKTVKQ
jgi:hypothetical protein